jgi:CheY-like chemotaxis protein
MPKLNGIQVIDKTRSFLKELNKTLEFRVEEPAFVFLTAYSSKSFRSHVNSLQVKGVYEKPLRVEQLQEIIAITETEYNSKIVD